MFGLELFKASGSCRCLGIVVMVGIKNRCSSPLRMTSGSSHRLNAQHDIITYNSATAFLGEHTWDGYQFLEFFFEPCDLLTQLDVIHPDK